MSLKFTSVPTKILTESVLASATSFRVNNIKGWNGVDLAASDFGTRAFGVFRNPTNTALELFEWDPSTIANNSITIVRRGLKFDAPDLTTEVAANKLAWTANDTFVDLGTDTPQMLQFLKEYIDAAAIAGGVPMTPSVFGFAKLSTAAVDPANPIVLGENDPRVLTADEAAAAEGGGDFGTPSGSNKFLTQEYIPTIGASLTTGVTKKLTVIPSTAEIANNTTTETNIFSVTIPANRLGTNNAFRFRVLVQDLTVASFDTGAPTFRLKYGATTVVTQALTASATMSGREYVGSIEGLLMANASATAQTASLCCNFSKSKSQFLATEVVSDAVNTMSVGTATENSATDLTFALTIQWSTARAGADFVPAGIVIEQIS